MRDVILRILGMSIVVSCIYAHSSFFERKTRLDTIIMDIGQKSLPIYLLQYFFIPDFMPFSSWISNLDDFTIHVITSIYTILITGVCLLFISLMEHSSYIRKYILGLK